MLELRSGAEDHMHHVRSIYKVQAALASIRNAWVGKQVAGLGRFTLYPPIISRIYSPIL